MKVMSKIKFFGHTKEVVYISESEHCNCTQLLLTGHTVIAHLCPLSDQENCSTSNFCNY